MKAKIKTILIVAPLIVVILWGRGELIKSEERAEKYEIQLQEQADQLQYYQRILTEQQEYIVELEQEDHKWQALVNATWRLETGNGSSYLWLNYNNAGGIKCGRQYCSYASQEEGMRALETLLARYVEWFDYDLQAIRYKYCGPHCGAQDLVSFTRIYNEELAKSG